MKISAHNPSFPLKPIHTVQTLRPRVLSLGFMDKSLNFLMGKGYEHMVHQKRTIYGQTDIENIHLVVTRDAKIKQ